MQSFSDLYKVACGCITSPCWLNIPIIDMYIVLYSYICQCHRSPVFTSIPSAILKYKLIATSMNTYTMVDTLQECDSKPVMTSAKFDSTVIKHKAELRVRYEKMVEQQKAEQERRQLAEAAMQPTPEPPPTADEQNEPEESEKKQQRESSPQQSAEAAEQV